MATRTEEPVSFLDAVRQTPIDLLGRQVIHLTEGATVEVGRLSLNQILALAKIAGRALAAAQLSDIAQIKEASITRDWAAILNLLEEDVANQLLTVVLGKSKGGTWTERLDLVDLTNVIAAIVDNNDVGPLMAVFTRAAKKPSPQSSETISSAPAN